MMAHTESVYDDYERMAANAMMIRSAYHAKSIKSTDLFKRPKAGEKTAQEVADIKAKQAETMRWLSQFEEFRGKE